MNELISNRFDEYQKEFPRKDGEGDYAYFAFMFWVKAGCPEIAEMKDHIRFRPEILHSWKTRFEWEKRLLESPSGVQAQIAMMRIKQIVNTHDDSKTSERVLKLIQKSLTKLFLADSLTDETVADPRALAALLKAVHEYERLEAGQSTQNHAVAHQHTLPPEKLDQLSAEELLLAKKLFPKLEE